MGSVNTVTMTYLVWVSVVLSKNTAACFHQMKSAFGAEQYEGKVASSSTTCS
jgi:hypothetical protein